VGAPPRHPQRGRIRRGRRLSDSLRIPVHTGDLCTNTQAHKPVCPGLHRCVPILLPRAYRSFWAPRPNASTPPNPPFPQWPSPRPRPFPRSGTGGFVTFDSPSAHWPGVRLQVGRCAAPAAHLVHDPLEQQVQGVPRRAVDRGIPHPPGVVKVLIATCSGHGPAVIVEVAEQAPVHRASQ